MLLKGAKILDGNYRFTFKDILVVDGKIDQVYLPGEGDHEDFDIVDLSGKTILPGLIDTHIHGAGGVDTMDADFEPVAAFLAKHGVTSFLPTTMTASLEDIYHVLNTRTDVKGAQILGFHLEGPYINPNYKGAQNPDFIKEPEWEDFMSFNNIKMLTIAPELQGAMEYIKKASQKFVVALGHTDCDYSTAVEAIRCGANSVTHLFNAMRPLRHREPGLIGAAGENKIYAQIISDGIHIHPAVVYLAYQIFGPSRLVLISDAMRATGLEDGTYDLGGLTITVSGGVARTESGNLAGSTATLWDCVKRAASFGIPFEDAVRMASLTPAKMIGADTKGVLSVGKDADLFVVDDDKNICYTMIAGCFQ